MRLNGWQRIGRTSLGLDRPVLSFKVEAQRDRQLPPSIQNDSGLAQGRKGHLRAHSVRQSAHALQIDAPGPKGERS
jgi:hypothetical protein